MMDYKYKLITFLKKYNLFDEEKYNYLINNAFMVDTSMALDFIGCFYLKNEWKVITKVRLCLPRLDSDIAVMLTIHEYVHGFIMYDKIGSSYSTKASEEVLPMLYEFLYFLENRTPEMEQYRKIVDDINNNGVCFKHKLGFIMKDELAKERNLDINYISNIVRNNCHKYIKKLKSDNAFRPST